MNLPPCLLFFLLFSKQTNHLATKAVLCSHSSSILSYVSDTSPIKGIKPPGFRTRASVKFSPSKLIRGFISVINFLLVQKLTLQLLHYLHPLLWIPGSLLILEHTANGSFSWHCWVLDILFMKCKKVGFALYWEVGGSLFWKGWTVKCFGLAFVTDVDRTAVFEEKP